MFSMTYKMHISQGRKLTRSVSELSSLQVYDTYTIWGIDTSWVIDSNAGAKNISFHWISLTMNFW